MYEGAERCVGIISVDDLIMKRACSIDDIAQILSKQISEPNAQHGLKPTHGSRAA